MVRQTLITTTAVAAFIVLGVGFDPLWTLFGSADLGPVVFETLTRRKSPNDALACPADLCPAASDIVPPVYPMPAHVLRDAMAAAIAQEERLQRVASDDATLTDRYVQRSRVMHFPDTIVVRTIERPRGTATLAIYSRSQLGHSDLGVNRARIERWLGLLDAYVQAHPPLAN